MAAFGMEPESMIAATPESVSLALDTIAHLDTLIAAEYETAEGQRALHADVADWYSIAPRLSSLIRVCGCACGWLYVALDRGETRHRFEECIPQWMLDVVGVASVTDLPEL